MKIAAISFSDTGARLIKSIKNSMEKMGITPEVYGKSEHSSIVERCFSDGTPLLFVGACGIAVRLIAPFVKDKLTDPPVLVMDEGGKNIVPILSGHVGGANELALLIGEATGAEPVITTATDVNNAFSIDSFAKENHLTINNKEAIKAVSSKVLKGEPIRIQVLSDLLEKAPDVEIGLDQKSDRSLFLSPKRYVFGIGCKKGKSFSEIEERVEKAIRELSLDYSDIYAFGSIDLKADEEGLILFSQKHRIPFVTFSPDLLMKAKGDFSSSDFVKEKTGVDNVCERAAVLLTNNRGDLIMKKRAGNGVTVAVARRF